MNAEGIEMHIDRADEIAVAGEAALAADPVSASGLMTMPADRTPARGASFGAGRARDAGYFGFVGQVVDVASVFPPRHALVVVPATVPIAHAVRIADEEGADSVFNTEVNDLAGGLVPQVAHAPLGSPAHLVLGPLQLFPPARMFRAAGLLFRQRSELFCTVPFEGTDAAPGDDQRLARVRGDGGQVNLAQVNGCLNGAGGITRLRYLNADVQFEAPVPHERARSGVVGKSKRQDQGRVASPHRQDHAPFLLVNGLGGPLDRVECFGAPGVLHALCGVLPAQGAGRLHVGEEGVDDLLHGLSIEGEPAFGRPFQLSLPRPRRMSDPGSLVGFHAHVPHAGRLHLRRFEAVEERWRETGQAIHANCFHTALFFLSAPKSEIGRVGSKTEAQRAFLVSAAFLSHVGNALGKNPSAL